MTGKCIIFSAPSGSGKSTIVHYLMEAHPEFRLAFSISATSRLPRGEERDGVDYHFLTIDQFKKKITDGAFLEYEQVYAGGYYGTLANEVEQQLAMGQNVVFDVDVKGGCNIKHHFGDRALSVFIQPPSIAELRRRLIARNMDAMEKIEERLAKAEYEMTFASQFDCVLVNDNLLRAKQDAVALLQRFLEV